MDHVPKGDLQGCCASVPSPGHLCSSKLSTVQLSLLTRLCLGLLWASCWEASANVHYDQLKNGHELVQPSYWHSTCMLLFLTVAGGALLHKFMPSSRFHFNPLMCAWASFLVAGALACCHGALDLPGGRNARCCLVAVFMIVCPFGIWTEAGVQGSGAKTKKAVSDVSTKESWTSKDSMKEVSNDSSMIRPFRTIPEVYSLIRPSTRDNVYHWTAKSGSPSVREALFSAKALQQLRSKKQSSAKKALVSPPVKADAASMQRTDSSSQIVQECLKMPPVKGKATSQKPQRVAGPPVNYNKGDRVRITRTRSHGFNAAWASLPSSFRNYSVGDEGVVTSTTDSTYLSVLLDGYSRLAHVKVECCELAKGELERKAKEEVDRLAKEETDRKAKEEAEVRKAKAEAERKVKEEVDRLIKEEADKKAKEEADRLAKEDAEKKAKEEADMKVKEEADRLAKEEAEKKAREEAERNAKEEADRLAKEEADRLAKEEAERKAKEEADRLAKEEAERKAKEEADRKAKEEADLLARSEEERKAKEEADKKAQEEADRKAKEEADRLAKEEAERKAKEEADRKAKEEADRLAKEEAERKAKEEADRKAKEEADRLAKEEAERKAKEEADRKAKEEADRLAKEEAERKAKEEADRKAREDADKLAKEEAERKAKEEADMKAKEEAEKKAKEEADRLAKEEAETKAKEEADRLAKEEVERKAKEEADRKAQEEADRKAKEEADRLAKEEAESKAKEEADTNAKEEVDKKPNEEPEKPAAFVQARILDTMLSNILLKPIAFVAQKAELEPAGKDVIQEVAEALKKFPEQAIIMEGHARGTPKENDEFRMSLSEERSMTCKKALQEFGATNYISTAGYGSQLEKGMCVVMRTVVKCPVRVKVTGATDLAKVNWTGKMDPYCVVKLDEEKSARSPTAQEAHQTPVWNDFEANLEWAEEPLTIQVWDEEKKQGDRLIGVVRCNLSELKETGYVGKLELLKDRSNDAKGAGSVDVDISFPKS